MSTVPDCGPCGWEPDGPPGGWFQQNEYWSVGAYPNMDVPGWTVVQLRRHAPGLIDLMPEELTSMGPTLRDAAAAIQATLDPERIYFISIGEKFRHLHIVLMPRSHDVPPDRRGSALHLNSREFSDPAEAERVGRLLREALSHNSAAEGR